MHSITLLLALLVVFAFSDADARPGYSSSSGHIVVRSSSATPGIARDKHGRIARSQRAKTEFKRQHPCPSTGQSTGACPGYVIDHVQPLKRGGADKPNNMQWQSREAAKQKGKTE